MPHLRYLSYQASLYHRTKQLKHARLADSDASPVKVAEREETRGILRTAVTRLPQDELTVFALKHDQGLTYAEIAEVLACSVRTAKYRMKAALGRIGREAERLGVTA